MTTLLGISAYYHDSAAALIIDGEIIAAAQEERFTRKKHDSSFPKHAIQFCLEKAGIEPFDLDYIVFYDKPTLKFDRLLETYLAYAPRGFRSFRTALPVWLKDKLFLKRELRRQFAGARRAIFVFPEHHESHAASAFFPSPFEEAAILTLDGVGEWTTASLGIGRGNQIRLESQIQFPHSLGLLYSAFTYYCGFKVNSGEYKLMGLAPYGRPVYRDVILEKLMDLKSDGSFRLHMEYFGYCNGLHMTNHHFHDLFGGPPRNPEGRLEQRHMDLAASIQAVTEEAVANATRYLYKRYGVENLVLAGGVALNCVANGKLLRNGPFKRIWIQPAAGDAGGALGASLFVWYQLLQRPRVADGQDHQKGSFLGPEFSDSEIEQYLRKKGIPFTSLDDEKLTRTVAEWLSEEKVVGWFQGRMEFGPRALGARSILGDARSAKMQSVMNLKIKFRESFRPFAPIVLNEEKSLWFELEETHENPYMLIVAPVKENQRRALSKEEERSLREDPDLLNRVNIPRSSIPAVTHVDYSARVQTVGAEGNPRLRHLLKEFKKKTGCPVLVNTSFNIRGEPIVCSPEDALRCYAATEMDAVVLGNCIVSGVQKERILKKGERERFFGQFELD